MTTGQITATVLGALIYLIVACLTAGEINKNHAPMHPRVAMLWPLIVVKHFMLAFYEIVFTGWRRR